MGQGEPAVTTPRRADTLRRADAVPPSGSFDPNCPVRDVLDRIGDKWSTLILVTLASGPHRFSAVVGQCPSIPQGTVHGQQYTVSFAQWRQRALEDVLFP